ncbi:MAG TPA: glycosyl transferase, partial [Asanoa sp.]|nr:glycosyl transferase [Asanoa sp.]
LAGLVGYLFGVLGRLVSAAATGGRRWPDPLAQPVSVLLFGALVARSYRLRRSGVLRWRDRPVVPS